MREIGSIREFETGTFKVVEDHIVTKENKRKVLIWLNVLAFPFLGLCIAVSFLVISEPIVFDYTDSGKILGTMGFAVLGIISFFIYIFVHEWLHGMAFRKFNGTTKEQLKFGVVWSSMMAYCISTVPVTVKASRLSLMMPVYVVCIPVFIAGVVFQNIGLTLLASYYFSGSIGDLYYMWLLRKTGKEYYMYEEMPTKTGYEIGYLLFEKIN